MPDDTRILTNTAAATRLRTLLHQLTREPLALTLIRDPTPEERHLLSNPDIRLETS